MHLWQLNNWRRNKYSIRTPAFDIVSAHDSFGSHAGNVEEMQKVIREQFKRIIDAKPLEHNLKETGNLVPMITQGQLDSSEILRSEYAFA